MPDEVIETTVATTDPPAESTGPGDISTFKPTKNTKLKSALLTGNDLSEHEAKEAEKAAEAAAAAKAAEEEEDDDPAKIDDPDDDHALPKSDDPFEMDDPMVDSIKKKTEPDPADTDDPAKPDIQKKKEGNAGLREEVKAANGRLEEQRDQFKRQIEGLNGEIGDLKTQLNESSNRLAYRNPDEHPDVQAITDPWDVALDTAAKEMTLTGGDGEKLKSLAPELVRNFNKLDTADADYDKRKDQIIGMVEENFPDDRKDVVKLISRGSDILTKANAKIDEVRQQGQDFEVGRATENHDAIIAQYDEMEKTYFNPSNELRAADPLNQKVLLRDLIDSDDKIKDKSEKIKGFVRFAMTPLALPRQSELDGMDEDQAAHLMQRRTGEHIAAKRKLGKMMAEALLSHAMFPVLSRDLAEATEALKNFKSNRPKPGGNDEELKVGDEDETPPDGPADITTFVAPRSNIKL